MNKKEKILFEGKTKIAMCNGKIHFERDLYGRDHEYSNCTCKGESL